MTTVIKTIISHENPDLDSILSIYLLKNYGGYKYPGVENATLKFYPAGVLPNAKSPDELEKDGIIAVDTGGGRFDNHPVNNIVDAEKVNKCASILVAEDLAIDQYPELKPILEFTRLQDTEGKSLHSIDPADHAFSLTNIIRGFLLIHEQFYETVNAIVPIIDALIESEKCVVRITDQDRSPVSVCKRLQLFYKKNTQNKRKIRVKRWFSEVDENEYNILDIDTIFSTYLLKHYCVQNLNSTFREPLELIFSRTDEKQESITSRETLLIGNADNLVIDNESSEIDPDNSQKTSSLRKPCSAIISDMLVLESVPELKQIISFVQQLHTKIISRGTIPVIDAKVDIFSILYGLNQVNGSDFQKTFQDMENILDSVVALGKDWETAISQYEAGSSLFKVGNKKKVKIVAVEAESGSVFRVARWKDKADLIIYQHPMNKNTTISIRRNGPLKYFTLNSLSRLVRTAEMIETKTRTDTDKLDSIGESCGWFLHSSEILLIKGSPKAPQMIPSKIPFQTLTEIVLCFFDTERKIPDRYCPPTNCSGRKCQFYNLSLPNCHVQRDRIHLSETSLGARLDSETLEKLRKLKESLQ